MFPIIFFPPFSSLFCLDIPIVFLMSVCLRDHATYSQCWLFWDTDHSRKGTARNHHKKNAKAEHRARQSPRRGWTTGWQSCQVQKEEEGGGAHPHSPVESALDVLKE